MTAPKSLPIDPKDLVPAAVGFAIGLGIMAFFAVLCLGMDLTLLVNHGAIPHQ
jgi:hypothetical protein